MRVGDAPGLADHTLPLAAHQNHPGEASDLTLCSRLFPHQAPARLLWNLLPFSRKENERKSPSKRSSSCQMEKPWLNLPLVPPLLPGDAPGTDTHPTPPGAGISVLGLLSPALDPPRLLWEVQGEQRFSPTPWTPHHIPTLPLPMGVWHFPSSQATPQLFPSTAMAMGKGVGERHPGSSLCHPTFPQAPFSLFPSGPEGNSPPPLF